MTVRGILVGLAGALGISAVCYFNDYVIRQGMLVPHLMPVVVYGGLVLFLLTLNPLLRRLRPAWVFTRGELATVTCLVLVACAIPSWGLVQCFPTSVMMPHQFNRLNPGWQQQGAIATAPPRMLADVSDEDRALNGYVAGLGQGDQHIGIGEVPWGAWTRTLGFWVPLMLTLVIAILGLALVFHRQWVSHEQLPYPISVFAHALLPEPGAAHGTVFRQRLFWVGGLLVFGIHLNNYLQTFWPQVLIPVRTSLDFSPLAEMCPTLMRGTGYPLLQPALYFAVIGIAYFIPSDVSFSMAAIPFLFCYLQGVLAGYGIMLRTGDHLSMKLEAFLFTGGYLGILLMLLYTGRRHYVGIARRACGLPARDPAYPYEVLGARAFALGTVLFVGQLVLVGLDWQIAILWTFLALMIFVVVSRTIAETGAFHIGSEIFPAAILMGFMGATALGPRSIIIMFLLSSVLLGAPGWSPMPFLVQGLKLAEMSQVKAGRIAGWTLAVLVLSLAVSLPVTLYWQYDRGVPGDGWPRMLSSFPFENIVRLKQQLTAQGTLAQAEALTGFGRFAQLTPNGPCLAAFGIALATALGIGFARLRFAWWPLHPVVFVFLGGHQAKTMGASFLIGWIIKTLVNTYGGARLYLHLKPLMIGLIAGDMAAKLVPTVVGSIIYFVTGHSPSQYYG
jgi:hypothetical protein